MHSVLSLSMRDSSRHSLAIMVKMPNPFTSGSVACRNIGHCWTRASAEVLIFIYSISPALHQHMCSLCSEISVDEVKEVASDLVSKVSIIDYNWRLLRCNVFTFLSSVGSLLSRFLRLAMLLFWLDIYYHDLSERLSASGQLIEV